MKSNFVKIPQCVFSSDIWKERRIFSKFEALADMYQSADFKSRELTASFRSLADRWGWCIGKVQWFISTLSRGGYITVRTDGKITKIIVSDTPTDTPNDTPNDTPTDTISRAYKNDNILSCLNNDSSLRSESKDKENISSLRSEIKKRENNFVKPTIEEIAEYCREKGYNIDAETFWNFYEAKGWMIGKNKMKNWRAACATWVKKRSETMLPQLKLDNSKNKYEENLW
jgi:hypothetical protein